MPFNAYVGLQDFGAPGRADARLDIAQQQEGRVAQDRNMELIGRAATHLRGIEDPAQRAASFEQVSRMLGQSGVDISQYREQATGPQGNAFLDSAIAATTKRTAPSAERYETVQDPYGRGGAGQRETTTGRIVGYQGPAKPTTAKPVKVRQPDGTFIWQTPSAAVGQPAPGEAGRQPPKSRNITRGDKTVTQNYDYVTKSWVDEPGAVGARFKDGAGDKPSTSFKAVISAEGKHIGTFRADDPRLDKYANKPGFRIFTESVQAATGAGLGALPGVSKKDVSEAVTGAVGQSFKLGQLGTLLKKVRKAPGMTGVRGRVGSWVGGIAGQVSEPVGEEITRWATGVGAQQLSAYRRDSRAIIAASIEEITGEESGRFTEAERAQSEQAMALLDAAKSPRQVTGALQSAIQAAFLARAKLDYIQGKGAMSLSTDAEKLKVLEQLIGSYNLEPAIAADTLARLETAYVGLRGIQ